MKSKPPIAAENNSGSGSPTLARKNWLGALSGLLAIVALFGTIFTLLGFGAALSLETFGLNSAAVYGSPFDFLVLSSNVLMELFGRLHTRFTEAGTYDLSYAVFAPALAIISLFAYLFLRKGTPRPVQKIARKHFLSMQRFSVFMWSKPWVNIPLVTLTGWIVGANVLRILLFLFITLIILPIIPSCIGYEAGNGSITSYVINPSKCAPLYCREKRMAPPKLDAGPYAICLRVSKDGKELGRGRKIERTQDAVFLFKPATGEVLSIPIKDAIVEQIDKL